MAYLVKLGIGRVALDASRFEMLALSCTILFSNLREHVRFPGNISYPHELDL